MDCFHIFSQYISERLQHAQSNKKITSDSTFSFSGLLLLSSISSPIIPDLDAVVIFLITWHCLFLSSWAIVHSLQQKMLDEEQAIITHITTTIETYTGGKRKKCFQEELTKRICRPRSPNEAGCCCLILRNSSSQRNCTTQREDQTKHNVSPFRLFFFHKMICNALF